MKQQTRVGMIGYSEGNGHPYSFSAIINGYNKEEMQRSPYPVIANYLGKRSENEFGIGDFKVTHVWAQDKQIAKSIAACTGIETTCQNYQEMADDVEVIIIARDDFASHRKIASFFLEKGKKVFVDKPLCNNLTDLDYYIPWLKIGQLMSCSGFRYYPDIVDRFKSTLQKEEIVFSHNVSIIDWFRYGIHVLEGITPIMGTKIEWVQDVGERENHIVRIQYESGRYALIQVNTHLGFVLRSSFYTQTHKHFTINYDDNFSCFKGLLEAFYQQCKTSQPAISPRETITIIKVLCAADRSLKQQGEKIYL